MSTPSKPGSIVWHDLTVPEADKVKDFYSTVLGWTSKPHAMKGYDDYVMYGGGQPTTSGEDGETASAEPPVVGGVCHARGENAGIPPVWLMYVQVESVEKAVAEAVRSGGAVINGPRSMGGMQFAALRDPAGAVFAVIGKA